MARLFGRDYTRQEILEHAGDVSQIARCKPYRLAEGYEDGVLAIDVTTGSGFDFTVLPDRGMDISSAHFNGKSLAWRSAMTDRHPSYFEPEETGWLRSFYGGLVVTCGMTWMGAACTDNGKPLGLHGRISHIPATNVSWDGCWDGDDYILKIRGKCRESIVFGENIQLTRTIWCRMGESRFFIEDEIENMGFETSPHMYLYHINVGFPAVDDNSRLISPTLEASPRDEIAADGASEFNRLQPPTQSYSEKCYFHKMQANSEGKVTAAIVNPALENGEGFGVYVTYIQEELPHFIEWKMMSKGEYVVGMEPANALVLGRDTERKTGRLKFIEPGEIKKYSIEIGAVSGPDSFQRLSKSCEI